MVTCCICGGVSAAAYAADAKLRCAVGLASSVRASIAILMNAAPVGSSAEDELSEVDASVRAAISFARQTIAYRDFESQSPSIALGDLLAAFREAVGFCRLCAARKVALDPADGMRCPGSPWPLDMVVGAMYAAASNGILSIDDTYRIDPLAFAGSDN